MTHKRFEQVFWPQMALCSTDKMTLDNQSTSLQMNCYVKDKFFAGFCLFFSGQLSLTQYIEGIMNYGRQRRHTLATSPRNIFIYSHIPIKLTMQLLGNELQTCVHCKKMITVLNVDLTFSQPY